MVHRLAPDYDLLQPKPDWTLGERAAYAAPSLPRAHHRTIRVLLQHKWGRTFDDRRRERIAERNREAFV